MKRIVILYPAFFEQSNGGAELQISYLCQALMNAGYEVHYIYEEKGKPIENKLNLILHPLAKKKIVRFCGKGWFRYRTEINRMLSCINPDVIYTRLGSSWIDVASKYAQQHHIRYVHALASNKDVNRSIFTSFFPLFQPIENFYINRGLRHCTLSIAQNTWQKEMFEHKFHKQCVLINQFTPFVDESSIHKDTRPIRILWIANFKTLKRPELFVNLAKRLSKYASMIKMEMYGRSTTADLQLLKEIQDIPWLEYKGEVPTEEMLGALAKSHLLISTSQYEGFSNTFVQAWMRKVPVISMGSNPNDIFSRLKVGYYEPNFEKMVQCVEKLIENEDSIQTMGELSYQYAVGNHSLESNLPKILNVL